VVQESVKNEMRTINMMCPKLISLKIGSENKRQMENNE
jgi:hypothetical protein